MSSSEEKKEEVRFDGFGRGHGCDRGHRGCRRHFWKFPFLMAAVVLAKSALVMLLWNYLIPDLFHGPILDYGQSIGLVVLVKLMIGFKGMQHFGGPGGRHRFGGMHRGHWKSHWAGLSPEEREKIRDHIRNRHGSQE